MSDTPAWFLIVLAIMWFAIGARFWYDGDILCSRTGSGGERPPRLTIFSSFAASIASFGIAAYLVLGFLAQVAA